MAVTVDRREGTPLVGVTGDGSQQVNLRASGERGFVTGGPLKPD